MLFVSTAASAGDPPLPAAASRFLRLRGVDPPNRRIGFNRGIPTPSQLGTSGNHLGGIWRHLQGSGSIRRHLEKGVAIHHDN